MIDDVGKKLGRADMQVLDGQTIDRHILEAFDALQDVFCPPRLEQRRELLAQVIGAAAISEMSDLGAG